MFHYYKIIMNKKNILQAIIESFGYFYTERLLKLKR